MYVFIRSCIALTRGVVKIIQTDPDSFFSSRSGTLSSTAAPTYHVSFSLSLFISTASFVVIVSSLLSRSLAIVPMPNWRTRRSSISRARWPRCLRTLTPRFAGRRWLPGTAARSGRQRDRRPLYVCVCVWRMRVDRYASTIDADAVVMQKLAYRCSNHWDIYSFIHLDLRPIPLLSISILFVCKNSFWYVYREFFSSYAERIFS